MTEEPGGLPVHGIIRVEQDLVTKQQYIYTYKIFANYHNQDIENSNQSEIFFVFLFNITSSQSIFSHHRLALPVLKFHTN